MSNIVSLPASTTMTPEQALLSALEFARNDNMSDVIVIGYDAAGVFTMRSSRMSRKDALWLAEELRLHTMNMSS